ncbi:hypothetical protein HYW75_03220 [Candidatus Pacearchaeota archaeon]|nr:hypothetical protein [Candidatus Pacearchaeota archaeon]
MLSSKEISIPYNKLLDNNLRPSISIKFDPSDTQSVLCLLDSGADFSTFPVSIGKKIGVDFRDEDPINPPSQISGKIKCKCYKVATSFYVSWQTESISLYVIWVNSDKVYPVLGRRGFFDKFKEVVFCEEEKKLIFRW